MSRDEFLELLRFEIEATERDEIKPGRNRWALLGALATVAWFILDAIEHNPINPIVAFAVFLAFFLIVEFVNSFPRISGKQKPKPSTFRFLEMDKLANPWPMLFINLIRDGALLALSVTLPIQFPIKALLVTYFSVHVFGLLGYFCISSRPFAVEFTQIQSWSRYAWVPHLLMSAGAILLHSHPIPE